MGWKMALEVVDHYRGPDHKWRWLVSFAWSASDKTRVGWPGRDLMAQRTGKSGSRVSSIASELASDGVLVRVGGGGRNRGAAEYMLLPLAQGSPITNPDYDSQSSPTTNSETDSQGSPGGTTGFVTGELQGSREIALPAETSPNSHGGQERSESLSAEVRAAMPGISEREADAFIAKIKSDGKIRYPSKWIRTVIANGELADVIADATKGDMWTRALERAQQRDLAEAAGARCAMCRARDHEHCTGCSCEHSTVPAVALVSTEPEPVGTNVGANGHPRTGRPPLPDDKRRTILELRQQGLSYTDIAAQAGVGRGTAHRICAEATP